MTGPLERALRDGIPTPFRSSDSNDCSETAPLRSAPRAARDHAASRAKRSRRPWGQIPEAIAAVLAPAGTLRLVEIHAAIEALLGERVAISSVKDCLTARLANGSTRFERVGRGQYRL